MSRRRLAALLAAVTLAPSPAVAGESAPPDPALPGPHAVRVVEYDGGQAIVTGRGHEVWVTSLYGALFVPSGPGPFPVVLFLHGVSEQTCEAYTEHPQVGDSDCTLSAKYPNHRGYDYLATNLASHGYLVASVWTPSGGDVSMNLASPDNGTSERAEILARHLDLIAGWHAAPGAAPVGDALVGRVDLGRIGAMGHSRGGEAVAALVDHAATRTEGPHYDIDAVFSIAPIDPNLITVRGATFATLLPMCDGDVVSTGGASLFDRGRHGDPDYARAQFAVYGANHNWFNTNWPHDDADAASAAPDPVDPACDPELPDGIRLTAAEQRHRALVLVASFFRRYLGGETAFDPLMTGETALDRVGTTYLGPASQRAVVVAAETTDAPVTTTGFAEVRICDPSPEWWMWGTRPDQVNPPRPEQRCATDPTRSAAKQYVLRYDGPATFAVAVNGLDASAYDTLTFRSAVNFPAYGTPSPVVEVTLRDTAGRTATVPVSGGHALTEQSGTWMRKVVLQGVRVPLRSFRGVSLARLAAVELGFGSNGAASVQLTDVVFQRS